MDSNQMKLPIQLDEENNEGDSGSESED